MPCLSIACPKGLVAALLWRAADETKNHQGSSLVMPSILSKSAS